MKKVFILIPVLIVLISSLSAQSVNKAFRKLDKENYVTAKVIFDEVLESDKKAQHPAACYGLALTFNNDNYRGHDPYKALKYALQAQQKYANLSSEQQKEAAEYVSENKITEGLKVLDKQYIAQMKEQNNIVLVEQYLKEMKGTPHYKEVVNYRDQLAWQKAKDFNTIHSYRRYIEKYPESAWVEQAQKSIIKLEFEQAVAENDSEAFHDFIKEYPESEYAEKAAEKIEQLEYSRAKSLNSIEYYDRFMEQHPESKKVAEIKKLRDARAFEMAGFLNTIESYDNFIDSYPEAEQRAEAVSMRNRLAWEQATEENTAMAFRKFITSYPDAEQSELAQQKLSAFNVSAQLMELRQKQDETAAKSIKSIKRYADEEKTKQTGISRYDTKGRVIEEQTVEDDFSRQLIYTYQNDRQGYPRGRRIMENGTMIKTVSYKTDETGNISEMTFKCHKPGESCRDYKDIFSYDNNLHLTQILRLSGDDTLQLIEVKTNASGQIIEKHEHLFDPEDEEKELIKRFAYSGQGRLLEETWTDAEGTIIRVVTYTWEGDRPRSILTYNALGKRKEVFQYNDKGEISTGTIYSLPGNQIIKREIYEYEYH